MAARSLCLLFWLLLARQAVTIQVTPDSPCASKCADSLESASADAACEDSDLTSTTAGSKWKACMSCLQNSTYTQDDESDQSWFLYNLRYSFDTCIFAYPNGTGTGSNPCETSTSCGALRTALEHGNLSIDDAGSDKFGYCDADGGAMTGQYYSACLNCVSDGGDTNYIANALVALEAGCLQRPNSTEVLGLSDSVFSSSVIETVDTSTANESDTSSPLSTAAIAGIAAGGGAVLILIAIIIFLRCRRHRTRSMNGLKPRWARDKRRSSFSFKCRNILASPLSPKFFTDLPPVDEHQQSYGSLNAQMSEGSTNAPAAQERYFIETRPQPQPLPYETSLNGWQSHGALSAQACEHPAQAIPIPDQWNTFDREAKRAATRKKAPITIDTSEAKLAPPPPAHPSPKENQIDISPSGAQPGTRYYHPAEHGSPRSQGSSRVVKPKTTTMSSQGSGYPSSRSPNSPSPLMKQQQQRGWPSARLDQEPWFPPPPPSGPPPSSMKHGRRVKPGGTRRSKRESGSPVESKQIQISFPGPPQR